MTFWGLEGCPWGHGRHYKFLKQDDKLNLRDDVSVLKKEIV
jgi:hypothetical protein